jgi:hypothetical protein
VANQMRAITHSPRASGRWIAWLNIDEVYLPGVLVTLLRHTERMAADVLTATASSSTRTAGSSACSHSTGSARRSSASTAATKDPATILRSLVAPLPQTRHEIEEAGREVLADRAL